ncbi:enoyl-CoA hydratase/isomerase family protein [Saccharopolyspora sp. TS4A08]|uniref:Enoyl-CoA hydratase/isomerase family protein n=1 Tax=Saccharopolyspora ipomoeae TaxID=3042027 RepID=A0ABT6PJR0_9PSEU|nr:enoyl-CoA hydratase/isomerase family protein [Saccharopolyspora sp. TS4A08]MDI2028235.1 enoyl-CoA hydratase/isomerase family protein [Saccharopolyspora sp. TS4A08]
MSLVRIERNEKVAELVLDREDKLNAFNDALFEDYESALHELGDDSSVSVIIVRGAGRAFSVGWDVARPEPSANGDAPAHRTAHEDWLRLREHIRAFTAVFDLPKPVVAGVHGYCMGGATLIPACADLAVVGEDTKIGWPVLPIGGGMLGPVAMSHLGPKKAKELSYTAGSHISGAEAAFRGWANYAVPADEVLDKTREVAREVSKTPLDMLEIKKRAANDVLIRQGFRETLDACAGWDALIHTAEGNRRMAAKLGELGISAARTWYAEGGSLAF